MKSSARSALKRLIAQLDAIGVAARVLPRHDTAAPADDVTVEVETDGARHLVRIEFLSRWTTALDLRLERAEGDGQQPPWLLVLPTIDAARRSWLRARRINHADLTGTLFLQLPGVRIQVDGDPKQRPRRVATSERPVNPFSKKASLVLRRFFDAPGAAHSVSSIARDTGIAMGWAWTVTEELLQRGYIRVDGEALRLCDPTSVLLHWTAAYTWKKCPRRNFVVPFTRSELETRIADQWTATGMPWALTLLSGAQRRVGHVMADGVTHVYAIPQRVDDLERALERLHAHEVAGPVPGSDTLSVFSPYYGPAALFASQLDHGVPIVSDLQLFLDLAHFPLRGQETAMHLLRTRLGPAVGMTSEEVGRIESMAR